MKNLLISYGKISNEVQMSHFLKAAVKNIKESIKGQKKHVVCRVKLFTKLTKGEKAFLVWYPILKEQEWEEKEQ